jgi:hypothetical protein
MSTRVIHEHGRTGSLLTTSSLDVHDVSSVKLHLDLRQMPPSTTQLMFEAQDVTDKPEHSCGAHVSR